MKHLTTFLVLALLAVLSGCATAPFQPPPICDTSPSLILERIPNVQALSRGLLTVQIAALEIIDGYTVEDAIDVLDQIEDMLNAATSYTDMALYIINKLDVANRLAGAMIFIIGDQIYLLDSPEMVSACDIALIRAHLAKQRMLLEFYS